MAHRSVGARGRQALLLALAAHGGACATAPAPPSAFHLVERERYQALYDANGRIVRLLQDEDGDGRAEAQILYWPNGQPRQGELDTDADGRVDRWEVFGTDGRLERIGRAASGGGSPAFWDHVDAEGRVVWTEPAR